MTPRRTTTLALLVAVGVMAAANIFAYLQTHPGEPTEETMSPAQQRWQALDIEARRLLVHQYETLREREDARDVLKRARAFAELPETERMRRQAVYRLLSEVLRTQPAARRSDWLRSPPQARAFRIYKAILTEQPERITRLKGTWGTPL